MIKKLLIKISSVFWISPKLRAKVLNGCIGAVSQEVERINSNCYFCGDRITIQKKVQIKNGLKNMKKYNLKIESIQLSKREINI